MLLLFSFVVFVLFAAGLSFAGVKMYVKPKEAIERVAGTGMSTHDSAPVHPSLLFHDLVKRLGNLVPASPKDVTVMQRRLIRAGYRNPNALKILYGAKAILAVLLPVIMTVAVLNSSAQQSNKVMDRALRRGRLRFGNAEVFSRDEAARALFRAIRRGDGFFNLPDMDFGIRDAAFVPFFGVPACTASGLARVALRTGAAVLPGFLVWEPAEDKYVLHFDEQIPLIATGDDEHDVLANTAQFTAAIEVFIRRYPDQWLWVHRRWKTRPEGEAPIY